MKRKHQHTCFHRSAWTAMKHCIAHNIPNPFHSYTWLLKLCTLLCYTQRPLCFMTKTCGLIERDVIEQNLRCILSSFFPLNKKFSALGYLQKENGCAALRWAIESFTLSTVIFWKRHKIKSLVDFFSEHFTLAHY